CQRHNSHPLTF
nr:immunoglobulin light chain junction region [Macaca mulatta]